MLLCPAAVIGRQGQGLGERAVCIDPVGPFEGSAVSGFWVKTRPEAGSAQFNKDDKQKVSLTFATLSNLTGNTSR